MSSKREITEDYILSNYYGGAYIDQETGGLVILTTRLDDITISGIRGRAGDSANISIKETSLSYREMCEMINFLTNSIDFLLTQDILITSISDDILNEQILVGIKDLTVEKENFIKSFSNCDFLSFMQTEECILESMPLGGGNKIVSMFQNSSTLGFGAKLNGTHGYIVSGHAAPEVNLPYTYNSTLIGSSTHTAYEDLSSADATFIAANSNFTPSNRLSNGGLVWGARMSNPPIGTNIVLLGGISGLRSGKIVALNATSYAVGKTITNQWEADYVSAQGDSGAPIMFYDGNYGGESKYTLYGIHRAAVTAQRKVLTPYKNIVDELGASWLD